MNAPKRLTVTFDGRVIFDRAVSHLVTEEHISGSFTADASFLPKQVHE